MHKLHDDTTVGIKTYVLRLFNVVRQAAAVSYQATAQEDLEMNQNSHSGQNNHSISSQPIGNTNSANAISANPNSATNTDANALANYSQKEIISSG